MKEQGGFRMHRHWDRSSAHDKVILKTERVMHEPEQQMIETDRLLLRRWQMADLPHLDAILGDHAVMEFSDGGALSKADQAAWLQRSQVTTNPGQGLGMFAIERKQDANVIGYISLSSDLERVAEGEAEIGIRLAKDAWGRGYATEALLAIIRHVSGPLRVVAIVDPDNSRSVRVLGKAGMTYERDIFFEGYDHADHLYVLEKGRQAF